MHHHLLDDSPGAGEATPSEGLLGAAGAMAALCVLFFALLFVV